MSVPLTICGTFLRCWDLNLGPHMCKACYMTAFEMHPGQTSVYLTVFLLPLLLHRYLTSAPLAHLCGVANAMYETQVARLEVIVLYSVLGFFILRNYTCVFFFKFYLRSCHIAIYCQMWLIS